jgi:Tfp pilus assembly protein PilN
MIQFNLLPDIKIQYLKARRQKHMVVLASTIIIIVAIVAMGILVGIVFGMQKKSISDLNADIKTESAKLESTEDLTKILTVQNQLKALPDLHDQKAVAKRLFGYVSQITPTAASIARLNVDFAQSTMTLSGSADTLETVNKFTDTLKFTKYTTSENDQEVSAFSNVVLSTFGRDTKGATYTITTTFDPVIFSEAAEVTLKVPNIITTRSNTEQPSALFEKAEGQ